MKKAVQVFLSLLLVVALIWSVISVGFAANVNDVVWTIYDNETTVLGDGGKLRDLVKNPASVNTVTDTLYTGIDGDGDGKAYRFDKGCYAQWPTVKIGLKANTNYELTAYFYGTKLDGYKWGAQGMFSDAVVMKDGGGKATAADHLSYLGRNSGYYIDKTGTKVDTADRINSNVKANAWNKITLNFYSGDCTKAVLAFRPVVSDQPIYIDNIQLSEVVDFKVATDWTLYDNETQKIGDGGKLRATDQYFIKQDDTNIYTGADGDDDGVSLAVTGGYAQYVTAKVAVEPNKNYAFTTYYSSASLNGSGGIFSHAIVIPNGGAKFDDSLFYMDANGAYTINDAGTRLTISDLSTTKNVAKDTWNKLTLSFYSGDLTEVLVSFRPTNSDIVSFDGFSLKEISSLPGVDTDVSDWTVYDNTTTKIGTGGKPTYTTNAAVEVVTDTLYTGDGADGDGKAYRLNGACYAQFVTKKMEFEADSYYELTAYYKASALDEYGGIFSHVRMVKDGGACEESTTDNFGAMGRSGSYYTNQNGYLAPMTGTTVTNVKAGEWNKITLSFYSGDQTDGLFTLRPAVSTSTSVYIDAITLTKVAAFPNADKVPSGWSVYTMNTEKIGTGGTRHVSAAVDIVTDLTYTGAGGDGDGKAYQLDANCYAQYATKPLALKADTYYNLTFYYYGTALGSENAILGEVKVVRDGTANSETSADNLGYLSRSFAYYTNKHGLTVTKYDAEYLGGAEANQWNQVTIPFYSGDLTSVLLSVRPVSYTSTDSSVGMPVYVDGITLTETSSDGFAYADTEPFAGWGEEPRDIYEINFDDFYVPMDMSNRIQLADAPVKDGTVTKAAHILQGKYTSATIPNLKAVGSDSDPVFTVPVKPNTKYSIRYSLYITEGQSTLNYFAFYYDFFYTEGDEDTTTIVRNSGMSERGEWVTFESFFTTKPDQTVCSMIWNAGELTLDMYIDDIMLQRIEAGTIADAKDTSYCEDFYNTLLDLQLFDDIAAAKSGVYKIPVNKGVSYILGLNAQLSRTSNSRVFLSFDGVTPMPQGMRGAPSAMITATGAMQRYGIDFMTDDSGYVYLVIENSDGALKISEPTLFYAYNTSKSENKGSKTDPNHAFLTHTGALKELLVPDAEDGGSASPATGSAPIWPVIAILATAVLALGFCFRFKKGGKRI